MTSLFVLIAALMTKPVPQPTAHFQLTVTPTAEGFRFDCTSGCAWQSTSIVRGFLGSVVVDNTGVQVGLRVAPAADATFAFEFSRTSRQWELHSLSGTAWTKLAWNCSDSGCPTAKVDVTGVGALTTN